MAEDDINYSEKVVMLLKQVRIFYLIKIIVEENEVLHDGSCGYLEHLFQEERRIMMLSQMEIADEYEKILRIYTHKAGKVERLLYLFPALLLLEKEDMAWIVDNELLYPKKNSNR